MTEITIEYKGDLRTECVHSENQQMIFTDAPKDNQGMGRYFSPTDLLAAALGSCILTIMGIMAKKLSIDLTGTQAIVKKTMQNAPKRRISKLSIEIRCPKKFDEPTTQKLTQAAENCPVHHSLHPDVEQEITFTWG
jgi:putative redox protein